MQDEVAACGRLRPARVALEVRRREGQSIESPCARAFELAAYLVGPRKVAQGRAHRMTGGESLENAVAPDEAGPAVTRTRLMAPPVSRRSGASAPYPASPG